MRRPRSIPVTVYSDYTCPWCYVGARRLERLREELAGEVGLRVEWRPFEIHPEVPPEGMPVEDLPYTPEQWEVMTEALRRHAEAEGLDLGSRPKVSNTHRALLAATYAQAEEPERFEEFHEALFRAYFAEGRDLGDAAVIRAVARESGMDVEGMEDALEDGRYEPVLEETTTEARRRGITGTPTFVFGDRYAAVGAQPVEALRRGVEAVLEDEGAAESAAEADPAGR